MTPEEMDPYRTEFDAACAVLGWTCRKDRIYHERDSSSWREDRVWFSKRGADVFSEDELSPEMVREIIRIAAALVAAGGEGEQP